MGDYIFLFDLDSTITAREILPEISRTVGKEKEMREITEKTMQGIVPFKESFLRRVELLKDVPVTEVNQMVAEIPLNEHIAEFIRENHDRCYVVTGNLDIWISGLMKRLDMKGHYYCSKASVTENRIDRVISVLDKHLTTQQFVQPAETMMRIWPDWRISASASAVSGILPRRFCRRLIMLFWMTACVRIS